MVIDYGDVVTAGGVLAWADLGLRLTERFLGPTVMSETARFMLVDPAGHEQRLYSAFTPNMKHGDEEILKAQCWLSTHRERPVSVAYLALQSGLEPRTFLRSFRQATGMKPSEYQKRLQISRAREMLEFSRTGVDEIASRVGGITISKHFAVSSEKSPGLRRPSAAGASHGQTVQSRIVSDSIRYYSHASKKKRRTHPCIGGVV